MSPDQEQTLHEELFSTLEIGPQELADAVQDGIQTLTNQGWEDTEKAAYMKRKGELLNGLRWVSIALPVEAKDRPGLTTEELLTEMNADASAALEQRLKTNPEGDYSHLERRMVGTHIAGNFYGQKCLPENGALPNDEVLEIALGN